jgi:transcriptional regulator with XRE-family HTH domain
MRFGEKLAALTDGKNKSQIARDAGLTPTAISDYLQKGYLPRADNALALARALGVSVEWLIDDSQGLPAKAAEAPSLSSVPHSDLMRELCRRMRLEAVEAWNVLNQIERMEWLATAEQLLATPFDKPVPAATAAAARLVDRAEGPILKLGWFDPVRMSTEMPDLPGSDIEPDELKPDRLLERWHALREKLPGLRAVIDYQVMRFTKAGWPEEVEDVERWRQRLLKELRDRKKSPRTQPRGSKPAGPRDHAPFSGN